MTVSQTKVAAICLGLMIAPWWMASPTGATEGPPAANAFLDSLPAAVRQTALEQTQGATIRGVSKEPGEDGATVYEVETRANGLTRDIIIGADGTLLISEQQVRLAALPRAVRNAILKGAGKKRIVLVESVTKGGTLVYYEAQLRSGKALSELKVDPAGKRIP